MPNIAGMSRRDRPSRSLYCAWRYFTTACAIVRRIVSEPGAAFMEVISWGSMMSGASIRRRPCGAGPAGPAPRAAIPPRGLAQADETVRGVESHPDRLRVLGQAEGLDPGELHV